MSKKRIAAIVLLIGFVLVMDLCGRGDTFGVPGKYIEEGAREDGQIDENWLCVKDIGENIAGVLFFDEGQMDATFSIYLNKKGLSFGYISKMGGMVPGVQEGIAEFSYDNNGSVLISMNKPGIAKIEIQYRTGKNEAVEIVPDNPFVYVIPENCNIFTLYDKEGNVVPVTNSYIK